MDKKLLAVVLKILLLGSLLSLEYAIYQIFSNEIVYYLLLSFNCFVLASLVYGNLKED